MASAKTLARMSEAAQTASGRRPDIDGQGEVRAFSNSTIATYEKWMGQNRSIVMAVRGTASLDDLYQDIKLAQGKLKKTRRFGEAYAMLLRLRDLPRVGSIQLTGHSLGGTIVILLGIMFPNIRVTAFNPGQLLVEETDPTARDRIVVQCIEGDPISSLAQLLPQTVKVLPKVSDNPLKNHSISTLIGLL